MDLVKGLMRRLIRLLTTLLVAPLFLVAAGMAVLIVRRRKIAGRPRLVWGSTPLINNSYWSRALREDGYPSETFVTHVYAAYKREEFDRLLIEHYPWAPAGLRPYIAFVHSLFLYDIFFVSFDGYFIGATPFARFQARILRLAGKKTIVIPYGADAYVYGRIRGTAPLHGLMMSYPAAAREQKRVARNVDYWCANADAVVPGIMGFDGFGRWDVLVASALFIDLAGWSSSTRNCQADGITESVVITHAPNHRGFKGSEFVVEAVRLLQAEGLKVELRLLEGLPNSEVRRVLRDGTDILVEQLIVCGHGLNGLEGMASGLPVISNLEDEVYVTPLRRWSYLGECPLVSASPETLVDVLRELITRPALRLQLGHASRAYAEKYHGLDSARYLFTNLIEFVYGRRETLINLYHPVLGEYPRRSPKIEHPLVNNRIVDA